MEERATSILKKIFCIALIFVLTVPISEFIFGICFGGGSFLFMKGIVWLIEIGDTPWILFASLLVPIFLFILFLFARKVPRIAAFLFIAFQSGEIVYIVKTWQTSEAIPFEYGLYYLLPLIIDIFTIFGTCCCLKTIIQVRRHKKIEE